MYLKKFWKILRVVLLALIAIILLSWLAIQLPPVQNFIVHKVSGHLSKRLGTEVSIEKVDIGFFNKFLMEGVLIRDLQQDTLLHAGEVAVNITDWFFIKDKIVVHYIHLKDVKGLIQRDQQEWNYQYLIDFFGSGQSQKAGKPIQLNFDQVLLENIHIVQKDRWRGETLDINLRKLSLDAQQFDITQKNIVLKNLTIDEPQFSIHSFAGNRPDSLKPVWIDTTYENDPEHLRWNIGNWKLQVQNAYVKNGVFMHNQERDREILPHFDGTHIVFSNINAHFNDLRFDQDSIKALLNLSTTERSGFQVKHLQSQIKWHPEAMEFHELDLQTNNSRLTNYYEMRYGSFDNMSRFIAKVRLTGNFDNTILDSDDLAFFAPGLKDWKKRIRIQGVVRGTVDNLSTRNLKIEAGQETYLDGSITMKGLPDIYDTYIDFTANEFRTTYKDVTTLLPVIKTVRQPYLEELQYLHFIGNFTGFITDFVTYGTFKTALGSIHSDLNMKFFEHKEPSYKGNIYSKEFQIGRLFHQPLISSMSFHGEVNGNGLNAKTMSARLDGSIESLVFKNYDYKDILVQGLVAQQLFNGTLSIKDTNFILDLDGLIDLGKAVPAFDFDAQILKMDLKQLNLVQDSIAFNGILHFNFEGDNIDNFLGTAKIEHANLYKNGERVSFDSLSLHSRMNDQNKILTLESNEFDAVLIGNFSIKDLPASFQTFLHKYYPSYINPSPHEIQNENFSFVVTTRNVSDYVDMFHKKLQGFNNSSINGRIHTTENLLDLNVDIPYFAYNDIGFQNVKLKGLGNYDFISLKSSIGLIRLNDSLYFPNTTFDISSSDDVSDILLKTSANKTLHDAQFTTRIQTMKDGVKILFGNSSFNLNGNVWNIDRNGELIISKELIQASRVRLTNGLQEILVATVPSEIGHTNDINILFSKVNLNDFAPFFLKQNTLEGLLSSRINVINPLDNYQIELEGRIEQMRFDNDSIGLVNITGDYFKPLKRFNFGATSNNNGYQFESKGYYQFPDSSRQEFLLIDNRVTNTKIDLLGQYLTAVFSSFKGFATGDLRISGPPQQLRYEGNVEVRNVEVNVEYTDVSYRIPLGQFKFLDDRVDFGSFNIYDRLGNMGTLTRGVLKHQSWNELDFDFALNTSRLLVLDTKQTRDEPFWGNIIARANMQLNGPLSNMRMDIRGEPADSSRLFIHNSNSRESGRADFITWKLYGDEITSPKLSNSSNLVVSLDVAANNLVNMYVILDEVTGDIINAQGSGNLKMRATSDGDFTITGRYDIERGNYNYNLQTVIDKPFKLREGVGNYIQWRNDPLDADIKIVAEYNAENVRFSDLGLDQFSSSGGATSTVNNNVRKYRGEVIVVATLTDQLLKPTITFALELPQGSPLRNDADAQALLQRITNDENELNKQVAFLIMFNSFGPLSTSNQSNIGNLAFEGVVMNTITGVVSNALSRSFSTMFQKLFNDKSIKVNFNAQLYSGSNFLDNIERTGFNIDRTNLNFNIGKSYLKERLTFTFGSALDFGLSSQQIEATQRLQFLPDITAEWKIKPDGKLLLTFFYRDNYNYLTGRGARQNRSGVGISWRKDFDNIRELLKRKKPDAAVKEEEAEQ